MQVLWWCLLPNNCSPWGKKPTECVLYFGGFVLSSSFPGCILAVFAVLLVAYGSSNSMKKNDCSVESCVFRVGSSMLEVLLSKSFLGLQNQLSFLHTYATLPLMKYYARRIVFRNLYHSIVFILCSTGTSSIALLSLALHIQWKAINNSALLKSKIQLFHSCIHFIGKKMVQSKMTAYVGSCFSEENLMKCNTKPRHRITTSNDLESKHTCIREVQSFFLFFWFFSSDEFLVEFF